MEHYKTLSSQQMNQAGLWSVRIVVLFSNRKSQWSSQDKLTVRLTVFASVDNVKNRTQCFQPCLEISILLEQGTLGYHLVESSNPCCAMH